jgi:hypothetical protein
MDGSTLPRNVPMPDFITPEHRFVTTVRYHEPMKQSIDSATHTLRRWALKLVRTLLGLSVAALVLVVAYFFAAYHFAYSRGESVGFVQKISHKGWVCKTWEGEQVRALAAVPAMPEKFAFTVREAAVVDQINAHIGQKVVLEYAQHKGLPSCFGDTEHFVTAVRPAPTAGEPDQAAK